MESRAIWRKPSARPRSCKANGVMYRETHVLLDDLANAVADGTCKEYMESSSTVPLLIVDDFGTSKLPTPLPRTYSNHHAPLV